MRRQSASERAKAGTQETADLAKGYPSLNKTLTAIREHSEIGNVGIRRLELNAFANGSATYKVWVLGEETESGGYLDKI